jgi:thiamine kinase-like enzyme
MIPLDVNNLSIDTAINEWGPKVKDRLPSMRGKLLQDNGIPHPDKLEVIDLLDRTFLFDGYRDYFKKLVPRDSEIVLAHNDAQENNILTSLEDNTKITLIDYEYGGWNPMAMDIANYLNECCLENAHPKGVGIKVYLENFPS